MRLQYKINKRSFFIFFWCAASYKEIIEKKIETEEQQRTIKFSKEEKRR